LTLKKAEQVLNAFEAVDRKDGTYTPDFYEIVDDESRTGYEETAKILCDGLRKFAENPAAIDKFEIYLSYHFVKWFEHFADCPENLAYEIYNFSLL
jgi:hypothetical protein